MRQLSRTEPDLLDRIDVAVITTDLSGLVLAWNRHAEVLYGWSEDEALGRNARDLAAVPPDPAIEQAIAASLLAGETWQGEYDVRRKDGSVASVHVTDSPLTDDEGNMVGVVSAAIDVTERKRAEAERDAVLEREQAARHVAEEAQRRLALLAEVSRRLSSCDDYEQALRALADLAVPVLADWCVIDVAEEDGGVRRLVVTHADPSRADVAHRLEAFGPDPNGNHPVLGVLRGGPALLAPELDESLLNSTVRDQVHSDLVREVGIRSSIIVPLAARGRTLAALTLATAESGRRFGPDERDLAEELAGRAALVAENLRLLDNYAGVARALQASLLPPRLPEIPGVDVAARYVAAGEGLDVGGDFYDVFDMAYRSWAVVIGDVCGRGAEAAAMTGLVRHSIRAIATGERRPSRILGLVDEVLTAQAPGDRFCTACVAVLRPTSGGARVTLASAGHPLPLVARADGRIEVAGRPGSLLGVGLEPTTGDARVDLAPGDALVLYTDGVTEAHRPGEPLLDDEGLTGLLRGPFRSAEEIVGRIEAAVTEASGGAPRDDVAILVIRVDGS